jgi:hypothetical protein
MTIKKIARGLLLLGGSLTVSAVWAGDTTARILAILLYSNGNIVYVYPVGGVQGAPSCHGSNGNYYSFSMTRPMAKEYLAALTAAQARGATVWFHGTGACIEQSVAETLDYITVYE